MNYKKIFLKKGKESSLERFHPWVFSGAVAYADKNIAEGEIVEVYTANKEFIAVGHFQIGSIAVRVLSFDQQEINHDFWVKRLSAAYQMRKDLGLDYTPEHSSFRLVHGEGDFLPGLIVDFYGSTAVMQAHSVGMHMHREEIAQCLVEISEGKIKNVYYKSETTLTYKSDTGAENGYLIGSD